MAQADTHHHHNDHRLEKVEGLADWLGVGMGIAVAVALLFALVGAWLA